MTEGEQLELLLRRFFKQWYRQHGRSFPWREPGTSPFGILVAEMLLRQTRAEMVAPVWIAFTSRYPDAGSCASASDEDLYMLLAPLGLGRQRVEALQLVSLGLLLRHDGNVPWSIDELVGLPHLGLYSAHAIACFAFNRRVPVVDVNVLRVFSRLTGETYGRDNRRAGRAWDFASSILPSRGVKEHNYGLLDFSAQVCTSRKPAHDRCPLTMVCAYFKELAATVEPSEHMSQDC